MIARLLPTGGCDAPKAIVASIDRSPHSARKISVPTYELLASEVVVPANTGCLF